MAGACDEACDQRVHAESAAAMLTRQYNYVLAAALDVGTGLSAILVFLVLILPRAEVNWWGNNVYTNSEFTGHPWCRAKKAVGRKDAEVQEREGAKGRHRHAKTGM